MSRRIEIVCDKCGETAPGTIDPSFVPVTWGVVELIQYEPEKAAKVREVRTSAQICGPCAARVRRAIEQQEKAIGGES